VGKPFNYGGQAVLEGVMMRGSRTMAVAVRHPDGHIVVKTEPLNEKLYTGPISRIPFLRGLVMLWDALGLGIKALNISANVVAGEETPLPKPVVWGMTIVSVGAAIGLFMALPSFLAGLVALYMPTEWLTSLVEGIVRLGLIVGYIWAIGLLPDIRQVFAYHGAEHKTIHAYEAGVKLTVENVRTFTTAHTRCGTAFLLTSVILAFLLFAPFGRLPLGWRLLSRIALFPVIAGVAYEFIRLTARFIDRPWMRVLAAPNLTLQRLTTHEPDDKMLEVAIVALKAVLKSEELLDEGEDILEAIERRVSTRSYDERPIEPDRLERLLALARTASRLTGVSPRVALISGAEQTRRVIKFIVGSYGLIQTPPYLLVAVIPEESGVARLDLGYVLEQVVLEATALGLGTCWITGTYDAQSAGDVVGLSQGEVAAAVIALGYPSERALGRIRSRAIRRLAGGRRKPLERIVFAGEWGAPWSPDGADPTLVSTLEHARLAPSAHNGQPWRFVIRPDGVALALARSEPIDAGVVMAHVALAAEALGRAGQWEVRWRDGALAQVCGLPQGVISVAVFTFSQPSMHSARR
jgi:uncharacterized protein YqhQ/nitroreductase